jgi:hypothetical protein
MSAALSLPGTGGHGAVLRALGRSLRGVRWLALAPLAMGAIGGIGSPSAAMTAFGVTAAITLQFGWWVIASGLTAQNHPQLARLVPGHVRQLRETALGLFIVISALSGWLMSALLGDVWGWMPAFALVMLVFSTALRWPVLWFVVWIVPSLLYGQLKDTQAWRLLLAAMVDWHAHQPLTQAAVLMLAMCGLLWGLFQDGGAAHARTWEANRVMRTRLSHLERGRCAHAPGSVGDRLGRFFNWATPLWREHLLRHARPTPASVLARAELAVLRGLHWTTLAGMVTVLFTALVLVGVVLRLWLGLDRGPEALAAALPGVTFGLMCSLIGPAMGIATTQHRTRREQALLLLVPGMPRGEAMNRHLAPRLFGNFLAAWAVGVAAMSAMVLLAPHGGPKDLPVMGLHFAAVTLPFGLLLWQDWAAKGAPSSGRVSLVILIVMLLVALSLAGCALTGVSPWSVLAASVVLTAGLTAWRWRAVRRMAPFWPTGRDA